jgi:hypothetical protein
MIGAKVSSALKWMIPVVSVSSPAMNLGFLPLLEQDAKKIDNRNEYITSFFMVVFFSLMFLV